MSEKKYGNCPHCNAPCEVIEKMDAQNCDGDIVEMPYDEYNYHPQQGAAWVKATERLPGWDTLAEWRFAGKEPTAKETVRFLFSAANLHQWEWLDETRVASESPAEQPVREVAIAFAEWLNSNFVSIENQDGEAVYVEYSPQEYEKKQQFKIAQLWEVFKKERPAEWSGEKEVKP